MTPGPLREPHEVYAFSDALFDSSLVAEWMELASSTGASYFTTPDWVVAWWRRLLTRPTSRLAVWRDENQKLIGIAGASYVEERLHHKFPLAVGLWINAGSGAGAADHLHPIHSTDPDAVYSWWAGLGDNVLLRSVGHARDAARYGLRHAGTNETFELPLTDDERPIKSRSTDKELARKERRLAREGVGFGVAVGSEIEPDLIDRLFELHHDRFDHLGQKSSFQANRRSMILELVHRAGMSHGPVVQYAIQDGRVIGADLAFVFGKKLYSYQSGWDPAQRHNSLGMVLLRRSMMWAIENGIMVFDLLRGDSPYKSRLGVSPSVEHTYLKARSASGRLLSLKQRIGRL